MFATLIGLRRRWLSDPLLTLFRRALPSLSDTERAALEAGTVWWDAELFSGRPDWNRLLAFPAPGLSAEEQAFLDGPVEQLCRILDDARINRERDLPPEVWRFIKAHGFFGMIIPREYGGLEFSAQAHSAVVTRIASRSLSAAVTVMVPNSLGPAELLLRYGTDEQKNHYLPRLADGREIPCFALTGPRAGSDAASLPDRGVVCHGDYRGRRITGIRLNWDKRYITLAPVATLMGLAFRLEDPDRLLGGETERGITLALIPTATPGIEIGRRHDPARQAFQNGPIRGRDVFVPLDAVIGGRDGVGHGWRMLMESLSAGRGISLPATGTAGALYCARVTGAYARVRKQFKLPIGRFEGVQEPLTRIAANAYLLEAARGLTATAVDLGERPGVISAIVKYHFTERMRQSVIDAMDVHGGKGVCDGPGNYLINAYYGMPVPITVEGANILTRSMIIFGQGALRCHPYLLAELGAAREPDRARGLEQFDRVLWRHAGHLLGNLVRTLWYGLSGARFASAPASAGDLRPYYRRMTRASGALALLADVTLLVLGGRFKRRESLSARFGDVLSELYLLSAVLKRFHDDGRPAGDRPLVDWICLQGLYTMQQRLDAILGNFPLPVAAWLLRRVVFPWGCRWRPAPDRLGRRCARLLLSPSAARDRLTRGMFVSREPDDITGCLEYALEKVIAAESVERHLGRPLPDPEQALREGRISAAEARLLREAAAAIDRVIRVDEFDPEELADTRRPVDYTAIA